MQRRTFLAATAAAATTACLPAGASASVRATRIRKAVKFHMIQEPLPIEGKFQLLKELGYDGVEVHMRDKIDPKEAKRASEAVGLPIHGVINSSNPDIVTAIDRAQFFGGDSVLVVAGRVNAGNYYADVYRETQEIIRRAIPRAEAAGVKILVENVWNNLLLSPLEMARYLDQFERPYVGAYFDVGNVVRFGWPQHWIRALGKRIVKLDIKEYSRKKQIDEGLRKGFQVELGEGDCDWLQVRQELNTLAFQGWATAEVPGGDRKRLADIAHRMDQVLQLKTDADDGAK